MGVYHVLIGVSPFLFSFSPVNPLSMRKGFVKGLVQVSAIVSFRLKTLPDGQYIRPAHSQNTHATC